MALSLFVLKPSQNLKDNEVKMQEQTPRQNTYNVDKKSKIDDVFLEPCSSYTALLNKVETAINGYQALPWYRPKYPSHRRIANKISHILSDQQSSEEVKLTVICWTLQNEKIKESGIFRKSKQSFLYQLSTYVSRNFDENNKSNQRKINELEGKISELRKNLEDQGHESARDMENLRKAFGKNIEALTNTFTEEREALTKQNKELGENKSKLETENLVLQTQRDIDEHDKQMLDENIKSQEETLQSKDKRLRSLEETLQSLGNLWRGLLTTLQTEENNPTVLKLTVTRDQQKRLDKTLEYADSFKESQSTRLEILQKFSSIKIKKNPFFNKWSKQSSPPKNISPPINNGGPS
jgi:chromosome segregation ATPase